MGRARWTAYDSRMVAAPVAPRGRRRLAVLRTLRQGYFVVLVALTGAGMGFVAVAFQELLKQMNTLFFGRLGQLDLGSTLLNRRTSRSCRRSAGCWSGCTTCTWCGGRPGTASPR